MSLLKRLEMFSYPTKYKFVENEFRYENIIWWTKSIGCLLFGFSKSIFDLHNTISNSQVAMLSS